MTLPKRQLGSSGLHITTLGFGAWAIGGGGWSYGWGRQDDGISIKTMRHAIDLGINWIDTAAVYGLGHSEELIGHLLRDIPQSERPLIFTKCGLTWDHEHPMKDPLRVLQPEIIRRGCEASLRRLKTDHIDLLQFHWPDTTSTPIEESWSEMMRLMEEGKIRAVGVSNFSVQLLKRCERINHVDSFQGPFSLIRRDIAQSQLPWCAARRTGVICYSPLQSGLLTDTFEAAQISQLPKDDWRHRASEFRHPRLRRNLALRDELRPIAGRHGTTIAAIAVAWTLTWPGVTGAIVGALTPEQVDGWIDASNVKLSVADLDAIDDAISRTGAGYGRLSWFTHKLAQTAESFAARMPKTRHTVYKDV